MYHTNSVPMKQTINELWRCMRRKYFLYQLNWFLPTEPVSPSRSPKLNNTGILTLCHLLQKRTIFVPTQYGGYATTTRNILIITFFFLENAPIFLRYFLFWGGGGRYEFSSNADIFEWLLKGSYCHLLYIVQKYWDGDEPDWPEENFGGEGHEPAGPQEHWQVSSWITGTLTGQ